MLYLLEAAYSSTYDVPKCQMVFFSSLSDEVLHEADRSKSSIFAVMHEACSKAM